MRSRMGGPVPKFKDYHIWKTLYFLSRESPIGRKKLASLLAIGEGSTRTILSILQEEGSTLIRKDEVADLIVMRNGRAIMTLNEGYIVFRR